MCIGQFDEDRSIDGVCVQSLDGRLTFFEEVGPGNRSCSELKDPSFRQQLHAPLLQLFATILYISSQLQEGKSFDCELPDFLVPGPLVWCPHSRSIITVNAAFELVSFAYCSMTRPAKLDRAATGEEMVCMQSRKWTAH